MPSSNGQKKKAARVVAQALARKHLPGRLIVVAGPSGVGKTSLCKEALEALGPSRIRWSISHTTRPRRKGEKNGREYYFVSKPAFEKMIRGKKFVEHAVVHENLYGTSKAELDRIRRTGADALIEIDVQGARSISRIYPEAVTIFILPPSLTALEKRLRGRGTDAPDVIRRRIRNAYREITLAPRFRYNLVNADFGEALRDLVGIIRAQGCGL